MEGKLIHRIFIGVEAPEVLPDTPTEGFFLCQENGTFLITEDNKYLAIENN